MRRSVSNALSIALAVAALIAVGAAKAKGLESTRISLPSGPGSVEGLGKTFTPSLASGTASYGIDIGVPPGAAGHAPKLSLDYDSAGGISDLGIGWQLGGVAEIRRRTENGIPRFDDSDAFEIVGFGAPSDLLEISSRTYRPQYDSGAFVRVQRSADGKTWEARDKRGTTYRFGGDGFFEEEAGRVATWLLREQIDVYGHAIRYTWKTDGGHGRLERVTYNDFSPETRNEIVLNYEPRPDAHVRFNSGIKEAFRNRVTSIEVKHGGALVRRYDLTYSPGLHSQLASVTMFGSDGATKLPTLSLAYTQAKLSTDAGGLVAMKFAPGRSPLDANVDIADVDGDGLPDLLVTKAGAFRTYLNHDGVSWKPPIDWSSSASPSLELSQIGVQLADLDGDGAVDLVAKSGTTSFRYFPGKDAISFAPPVSIATVPNFTFEDPDVRVADMDGDRRADVVITTSAGLAIGFNKNGVDWTTPTTIGIVDDKQPLRFSDGKTQLCDINGDRVQDLCYLRSGSLVYWLGRGRGKFEPAATATGVPEFDITAPYQLVDLDGDGWLDLVRVGVSNVEFSLATGEGAFGAVNVISGTPTKGPSGVVKLADMNGSGTTDIVWIDVSGSPDTAWRYLELFPEGRGGLLRTIDNGLGKHVTITYAPAARDAAVARDARKPWASRMNIGMSVVKTITVESGLADPAIRTEYVYRDGTFSPVERTFAGFAGGVEKAIGDEFTPTLLTDSTFDVGLVDRTLRGVLLGVETRNEAGYLFSRTKATWTTRKLDAALDGRSVTYSFKTAEEVQHIEGNDPTKARTTLTEWEQDAFGNVTAEKRWGEVVGGDKLAGNDEAITIRTFANNTADWLLGRVATEELQDGKGARVTLRRVYYDGAAFEGLPLGQVVRGNISREEAWVGPTPDAFELVAAMSYDADGNPLETRDARGGGRLFEWDKGNRTFISAESVKTGTRVLTQHATFNASIGALVSFTSYNGSVTTYGYDALARITTVIKPGDTAEKPTHRYGYELSSPISRVTIESRKFTGLDDVELSINAFDGMSRRRATLLRDHNDRWTVAGVNLWDARGNPRRSLLPFWGTTADVESPPLLRDGPGESVWRDALGRTTSTRSQIGIETRATFEPLVTKTWDGAQTDGKSLYEHTPSVEQDDGLGRLVAITRTLEGKAVLHRFGYDAAGRLASRTDAENNVARYTYDGRGRRLSVDDPDAGKHQFVYDKTGNVVEHRGPDGKNRIVTYDLAARPLTEDWNSDGTPDVVRTYDDAENGQGLIATLSDPSGGATFFYDPRQRLARTELRIQDAVYSVGASYDAQDRKYLHVYPDGSSIRIHYGPRGLIEGYGKDAVQLAYEADSREVQRKFSTGVVELNGYDADRRRTANKVTAADGSIVQHLEWVLDGVGNVLELRDRRASIDSTHDRSTVFGYDNLYRLRKETGRWGETSFAYSASGNLTSRTSTMATLAGSFAYGVSAGPHALTTYNGRALKYDARGRLLDDGERTFAWDAADHLTEVTSKNGGETNQFDGDGTRRVRIEREGAATHTTHFIDEWSEVRDGKLARYVVHGGQRIVRLSDGNGRVPGKSSAALARDESSSDEPPSQGATRHQVPVTPACEFFLAVALVAAMAKRYRHQLRRTLPGLVAIVAFTLVAGASAIGCAGCSESSEDPPTPVEEGSVLSLTEEDELLFADAIGSLTETTTGSGKPKASTAAFAYGTTRYDSSTETRKFANTPRDAVVGLDQMGERSYAADVGVWVAPDPLVIHDPDALVGRFSSAAYTYAGANPVKNTDRTGLLEAPNPQQVADSAKTASDWFAKLGIPVAGPVVVYATGGASGATAGAGAKAVAVTIIASPVILVAGVAIIGAYAASGLGPTTKPTLAPGSASQGLAAAPVAGTSPSPTPGPPPPLPAPAAGGAGSTKCPPGKDGVLYMRKNTTTGGFYIGQAETSDRYKERKKEHQKKLDSDPATKGQQYQFKTLETCVDPGDLSKKEEDWIRAAGGVGKKGGTLENKRYEMSEPNYKAKGGTEPKPTK